MKIWPQLWTEIVIRARWSYVTHRVYLNSSQSPETETLRGHLRVMAKIIDYIGGSALKTIRAPRFIVSGFLFQEVLTRKNNWEEDKQ